MTSLPRKMGKAGFCAQHVLLLALAAMILCGSAGAADRFIILQSTTSTENSGLFNHLLPIFRKKTGIEVRVVAVGTGQAIRNAMNGDGDVLLVHDRAAEEKFVADGFGVWRYDVMHNDYVLVGPAADPAGIRGSKDVAAAFGRIAQVQAPFVSRGDNSGTHKAELRLWSAANIDVKAASGTWYREAGQGMGATLNVASGMKAYALTDRATWSSFKNRGTLQIMAEGDERLLNSYGAILVDPKRHPHIKAREGQAFIDWLISDEGQAAITDFRIEGEQQFFPSAWSSAAKGSGPAGPAAINRGMGSFESRREPRAQRDRQL